MPRYTIAVSGAELQVDNGRVRFERNREPLSHYSTDVAGMLILAAAYTELDGRRRANVLTHLIAETCSLCVWVAMLIRRRGDARRPLPLPYKLFLLAGSAMRVGPFRLQKTNAESTPPSLCPADQLTVSLQSGGTLDVTEAEFAKLMNTVIIELLGPMYQEMQSPWPSQDAQRSPGLPWLHLLATASGVQMWLTWVFFRPFVWFGVVIRRAWMRVSAEAMDGLLKASFEASRERMAEIATEAARTRDESERELALLADKRLAVQTAKRELAEARDAFLREKAEHQREHERLTVAHAEELAEEKRLALEADRRATTLDGQLQLANAKLKEVELDRDNWKAACSSPQE